MPKGVYKRRTHRTHKHKGNLRTYIQHQLKYHQNRIKILKLIQKVFANG